MAKGKKAESRWWSWRDLDVADEIIIVGVSEPHQVQNAPACIISTILRRYSAAATRLQQKNIIPSTTPALRPSDPASATAGRRQTHFSSSITVSLRVVKVQTRRPTLPTSSVACRPAFSIPSNLTLLQLDHRTPFRFTLPDSARRGIVSPVVTCLTPRRAVAALDRISLR